MRLLFLLVILTTMSVRRLPRPPARSSARGASASFDLAMTSDYALRQCAHLCNVVGPRLSGSDQAEVAVAYVAAELRKLGLEVRLEPVKVPH